MKTTLPAMIMALTIWGCGAAETTEKVDTVGSEEGLFTSEDEVTGEEMTSDESLAGETISGQIDEAVSSIAEEADNTSAAALSLRGGFRDHKPGDRKLGANAKRHRVCSVDGDKAIVEMKRNFSRSFEKTGKRSMKILMAMAGTHTRTWAQEDNAIACKDNGKAAEVPKDDVEGLTLDVAFDRSKIHSATFTNKKGDEITRLRSFQATGERYVKFLSVSQEDDDSNIFIEREQTKKVTRKMQATNKKGEERVMEHSITTKEAAPMLVTIERDKDTHKAVSRTIKSGTLVATGKKGAIVETVFTNVKYESRNCFAVSGSISGSITKPDEDEASVTFEISFDNGSKSIVFSDGREHEYTPDGCELEKPEEIEEVETETEVEEELEDAPEGDDESEDDSDDDSETEED